MSVSAARFAAILFTALALGPALGHLLELPNKIELSRDDYLTVPQIYRGWALLGFVVVAALVSTIALAIIVRHRVRELTLAVVALACIVGTQILFWIFTYPANQQTKNWTLLPEHWMALRAQWEYSHGASAVHNLLALIALIALISCAPVRQP